MSETYAPVPGRPNVFMLVNKDAVIASLQNDFEDIQTGVVEAMKTVGGEIKKGLQNKLQDAPDDKTSSSPGQAPFSKTGELKKGIRYAVLPLMLGEPITLKIWESWRGFYGHMLEFGTSKMPAHPWFFSGIIEMLPFLKTAVEARISEVVKRKNELGRRRGISSAKGAILRELRPLVDSKEYFALYRSTLEEVESFAEERFA